MTHYEKHKEELKAKQIAYNQEHREEIKEKRRAKVAAQKENGTYKPYKKPPTEKQQTKKMLKELERKFNGFTLGFDENIIIIEVKLPFRCIKEEYEVRHCDDDEISKIQKELRNRLRPLLTKKNIVVVECSYLQLFISKEENIDAVCEETVKFLKEKTEIYGKYEKNGKLCNSDLLKQMGLIEKETQVKPTKRVNKLTSKPVLQYSLDGEFIKEWDSIYAASESISGVKGSYGNIYKCCKAKTKTAYGFVWRYKSDCGMSDAKPAQYIKFNPRKRVAKTVLQYSLNGEFIREWYSDIEAAAAVGGSAGNIRHCCLGHYKKAYGYVWKYKL